MEAWAQAAEIAGHLILQACGARNPRLSAGTSLLNG
jgi:hypothetical protein